MKQKILSDLDPNKLISIEIANISFDVDEEPQILHSFVFQISDVKGKSIFENKSGLKMCLEIK